MGLPLLSGAFGKEHPIETYLKSINELLTIHRQVAGFNPALARLYPIAIVDGDEFLIYDRVEDSSGYRFIKKEPIPMPIPRGVRAAFPLEAYGGRIACVVTPEVFDTLEGYVTILHEFVHGYQFETCELTLKNKLDIALQAQEKGDFMWKIQHPFPYQAGIFARYYQEFLEALSRGEAGDILAVREVLYFCLGRHDFEYMVWQEWKEGFARWIENRLRIMLGLPENSGGRKPPFSRVTFYAGGAVLVDYLQGQDPTLAQDLGALFYRISLPMIFN
ncbi:MAG: hypothetical protein M0Q95_09345 [Porticoccaceae bacterium]|nr:hypothetical protein [Porticoccaceae bacterium]